MRDLKQTYWVWDVERQEISVNSRFLMKFGRDVPIEDPGKFWEYLIDSADHPDFKQKVEALLDNSERNTFSIFSSLNRKLSLSSVNIHITGELVNPTLLAGHIELTDQELPKQDGYLLNLLMDHLPHSIFFKDLGSRFIRINQTCAEKFGLETPDEAIGKTDFDFFENEHAQAARNDELRVIETGKPIIDKLEKEVFSDGHQSVRWTSTTKIPMYNENGEIIGTFGITADVTDAKKRRDELKETIDIITHQKNRFQNFAHIVSHNLRNHAGNITMIMSLMEVLESEKEKDELLEQLNIASDRLNETINDLNEIVDVQSKRDIELKPVSIYSIYQKVKDILSSEIFVHNVDFVEEIPKDFEVEYNPSYMESILLNLISNAIKYRDPDVDPLIEVSVYQCKDEPVLKISDNGLGIDMEKNGDKLFGMYNTFHGNSNAKGIGLYLTKNQIESLGGSIQVESTPGEGTTFTIYFGT